MRHVPAIAGICLIFAAEAYSQEKIAVPTKVEQDAAEQLIKEVFKADFAKSKLPADRLVLAQKLLSKGIETKDNPAGRYVLFQMASDLASDIGAVGVILDSAEQIVKSFDTSGTQVINSLTKASKVPKPVKPSQSDLGRIMRTVEQAVDDGDFELALKYLPIATFVGRNLSTDTLKVVTIRSTEIEQLRKAFPAVQGAKKTLETAPKDPEASLIVGKYMCFLNGEWDSGLKLLAQSADANLKALAEKDLADPAGGMDWIALGDAWWDVAQSETGFSRAHVATHADSWYQKARSTSSGLTAAKLEQRRKDLDTFIAGTSLVNRFQEPVAGLVSPKHAVTQGRFTVWTDPHPIVPGRMYELVIQVHIPPDKKVYNTSDFSGIIIGSDAYKQVIRFPQRATIPVKDGQVTLRIRVPGADRGVRTSVRLESKMFGEKETFDFK